MLAKQTITEILNKFGLAFTDVTKEVDTSHGDDDRRLNYILDDYRGKGIGRKLISTLVQRGRSLGFDYVSVGEIYDWNELSRQCCESIGFRAYEKTEKGSKYRLNFERT